MKNLKFLLFPTYVSVTLIKAKLQVHPVNPTNHEVLINKVLIKKSNFILISLKFFETTERYLLFLNLLSGN